jgi:hypothetical protein
LLELNRPVKNIPIAARLAHAVQLLAAISPQSLVSLDAECRQNAADLVDDRTRKKALRQCLSDARLGVTTWPKPFVHAKGPC